MQPDGTKWCSGCEEYLQLDAFSVNRAQASGRHTICKDCDRAKNARPEARRRKLDRDLQSRYGISLADYEAMLQQQGGTCAICHRPETVRRSSIAYGPRRLCVDHCHSTGRVRALLCSECNSGLGRFQDVPDRLRSAAAYLERHAGE